MKWIAVESSAIAALGYETSRRRFGIEFRENRLVYIYYEVPRGEFEDFLKAESKGRYLTHVFLPKGYSYSGPYPNRMQAA
jgi:KTSC domain